MTIVQVTPLPVRVDSDWLNGRPRRLRLGAEDVPILAVDRVREEALAYPAGTGPRTRFEVLTPTARLLLTFEHRRRRWLVEGLDPDVGALAPAA